MQSSPLLTRPEAAALARIAVRTLDSLLAAGAGPTPTRIGRRLLIAERDFETWLESRRKPASDERAAA